MVFSSGGGLAIFCIAHGFPRPSIQWLRNGEHYELNISESQIGNNVIKSMIEIEDATDSNSGYYECLADNSKAQDKRAFEAVMF